MAFQSGSCYFQKNKANYLKKYFGSTYATS